jgi:hypothetical protein
MRFLFILLSLAFLAVPSMAVDDWASCQSALENVKSQSSRAVDAASEAENAAGTLNEARDDLRDCRTYPDVYDLMGDHCRSKQWDVDSAKSSLDSTAISTGRSWCRRWGIRRSWLFLRSGRVGRHAGTGAGNRRIASVLSQ